VIGRPKGAITPPCKRKLRSRAAAGGGSRGRGRLGFGLLTVLSVVMAGCFAGPMSSLDPAGKYARSADHLLGGVMIIVALIFFAVEGGIVFLLFKYRERPGDALPVQIHGHTRAEVIWTIIPALILAGVAIPTVKMIFDFAAVPPASTRIDACVTGHQWWWEYQYMKTNSERCPATGAVNAKTVLVTTANELHIPIKTPIYLSLQSVDVIHSFWVPRLNGKQDLIPAHVNHITIEADQPGTYLGQCSQFCGLSHANMRLRVIAMTRSGYDAWLAAQQQPAAVPTDPTALAGLQLFLNGRNGSGAFSDKAAGDCASCHTINGLDSATTPIPGITGNTLAVGTKGPNLTHLFSREYFAGDTFALNDANLRQWLTDPPGMKPGVDMPNLGLSSTEIDDLIAYLDTLK
jgi:cytochrome c oxidase subunit 2